MLFSIDHGNYAVKTPNTSFTSALLELSGKATIHETDTIEFKNRFWTLSHERINYMRDKTHDDRFFVLTLFAIAKELIHSISGKIRAYAEDGFLCIEIKFEKDAPQKGVP